MIEGITAAVKRGVYLTHVAPSLGVSIHTIYHWQAKGRRDLAEGKTTSPEAKLEAAVQEARGFAFSALHSQIEKAAAKDWRAAAWLLERQLPHLYGRNADDVAQGRAHGLVGSIRAELDRAEEDDGLENLTTAELEALHSLHDRELEILRKAKARPTEE